MFADEPTVRFSALGDGCVRRSGFRLSGDCGRDVARDRALVRDKGRLLWTFAGFWS